MRKRSSSRAHSSLFKTEWAFLGGGGSGVLKRRGVRCLFPIGNLLIPRKTFDWSGVHALIGVLRSYIIKSIGLQFGDISFDVM